MRINPIFVVSKGNNNNLKIKIMTKYYINGKEISKEEAENVKAKNAELQKSDNLNDWLGIQWIIEINK